MTLRTTTLAFLALTPTLFAQTTPAPSAPESSTAHPAPPPAARTSDHPDNAVVHTFYLTNVTQVNDGNELLLALRNILPPDTRLIYLPSQQAITVRGTAQELDLAQKLLRDLDRPRKPYRLTYTITETDGGKRIGTQHFAMVVVSGGRSTLKQGDRIPVATGSYGSNGPNSSTPPGNQIQFTYLDVGMNLDASLDDGEDGVRLRTKVEQSSLASEVSGVGPGDPIIRQTVLEGTSILTPGKPVILGSLDVPGTTRHLDIDVMLDPIQ